MVTTRKLLTNLEIMMGKFDFWMQGNVKPTASRDFYLLVSLKYRTNSDTACMFHHVVIKLRFSVELILKVPFFLTILWDELLSKNLGIFVCFAQKWPD